MDNAALNQLTLLVVDDEFIAQHVLAAFASELTQKEALTAGSGREALDALNAQKIDILLTDINMPQMDGITLTKAIRQSQAAYQNLPIVGITANDDPAVIKAAKAAGMNAVLVKPISQDQLAKELLKLIG